MNQLTVEYVKGIHDSIGDLPDGYEVLQEGIEMGKQIPLGRSLFLEESGSNFGHI